MEAPFQFVRRYWNPAAVLDALDIKPWPPSADQLHDDDDIDDSFYAAQQRPAREESPRDAAPSVAPSNHPATGFSRHQQQPHPQPPPSPWLSPRDAALRIQSAYRGHQVREGMRRVKDLEDEVGAVEMRIMADLDKILGDGRERKRVNQMIMDVLLRLDGVQECYRPYRKRVIKKAISLQEALDCLVGGDETGGGGGGGRDEVPDPTVLNQLGREASNQWIQDQGICCHEEDREPSRSSSCGFKDALLRVIEENMALRCCVGDLTQRNEQQAAMMQQLTDRVRYLEKRLRRLSRKRRICSRYAGGEEGGGRDAEPPATPSSSSAGKAPPDHDDVCRGGDAQNIIDRRDAGCDQQDDPHRR